MGLLKAAGGASAEYWPTSGASFYSDALADDVIVKRAETDLAKRQCQGRGEHHLERIHRRRQ